MTVPVAIPVAAFRITTVDRPAVDAWLTRHNFDGDDAWWAVRLDTAVMVAEGSDPPLPPVEGIGQVEETIEERLMPETLIITNAVFADRFRRQFCNDQ